MTFGSLFEPAKNYHGAVYVTRTETVGFLVELKAELRAFQSSKLVFFLNFSREDWRILETLGQPANGFIIPSDRSSMAIRAIRFLRVNGIERNKIPIRPYDAFGKSYRRLFAVGNAATGSSLSPSKCSGYFPEISLVSWLKKSKVICCGKTPAKNQAFFGGNVESPRFFEVGSFNATSDFGCDQSHTSPFWIHRMPCSPGHSRLIELDHL